MANPALLSTAVGKSSQGSGDKSLAKGDDKKEQRRQKAGTLNIISLVIIQK